MLWQGCVYDLVMFSHRKHLVGAHVLANLVPSGNCLDILLTLRVVRGLSVASPLALAANNVMFHIFWKCTNFTYTRFTETYNANN